MSPKQSHNLLAIGLWFLTRWKADEATSSRLQQQRVRLVALGHPSEMPQGQSLFTGKYCLSQERAWSAWDLHLCIYHLYMIKWPLYSSSSFWTWQKKNMESFRLLRY